jgi:hypothetical protein
VLVKKPLKLPRAVLEIRYARFGSLSLKSTPILPTRLSGVCSAGSGSLCGSGASWTFVHVWPPSVER